MKYIKVSLFQKGLLFIINLLLLINILLIPQSIFNILDNYMALIFYIINITLFYYVLKNNLLAIKLYWIFIILNILWFSIIYWYSISIINNVLMLPETLLFNDNIDNSNNIWKYIFIWFLLLSFFTIILLNLSILYKNIKKWTENLKTKLLTSKNQIRIFIVINIFTIISLIIFRFWYYTIEKDIEDIDESFFITKYQNIDVADEDNLYTNLKNFEYEELEEKKELKQEIVRCLYKNICFPLDYHKDMIEINNGILIDTKELKKKRFRPNCGVEEIREFIREYQCKNNLNDDNEIKLVQNYLDKHKEILFNFKNEKDLDNNINDLIDIYSKKKYFKSNINEVWIYTGFIRFNRDIQYKILYYLNSNEEKKAIDLINAQINTSLTMADWDTWLIDVLVAITTLKLSLENLDLVLNNFSLTEESKKQLKNTLSKNINYSAQFENIFKNEHKSASQFIETLPGTTTLYNHDYTMRWFEEMVYDITKNKWELSESILVKYQKINYLKKNQLWQLFWTGYNTSYKSQYNKIVDMGYIIEKLLNQLANN